MEPAEIIFILFGTIYVITSLLIGIYLLYRIKKTRLFHITWLSAFYIFMGIEFFVRMAYLTENKTGIVGGMTIAYCSVNLVSYLFLIVFVKYTFFLHRKSPFLVIISTTIIIKIIFTISSLMYRVEFNLLIFNISKISAVYLIVVPSLWLVYSALSVYKSVQKIEIQEWIKKRYLLVGISAMFLAAHSVPSFLTPYKPDFGDPYIATLSITHAILILFSSSLSFITWFMPKRIKQYLNRGSQLVEEKEFTEEELMTTIKRQLSEGGINGDN